MTYVCISRKPHSFVHLCVITKAVQSFTTRLRQDLKTQDLPGLHEVIPQGHEFVTIMAWLGCNGYECFLAPCAEISLSLAPSRKGSPKSKIKSQWHKSSPCFTKINGCFPHWKLGSFGIWVVTVITVILASCAANSALFPWRLWGNDPKLRSVQGFAVQAPQGRISKSFILQEIEWCWYNYYIILWYTM